MPSLKKEWGSLMQDSKVVFEVMGRYESVPIDMGGRNWRPMRHEGSVSMVSLATMRSIKWNECRPYTLEFKLFTDVDWSCADDC